MERPTALLDRPTTAEVRSGWLADHPVAGFVTLTYAISWTLWGLAWLMGDSLLAGVVFVAGGFGPAAAAGIMLTRLGEPLGPWARAIVHWRVPPAFWAYALGLPLALSAVTNLSLVVMGEPVELSLLTGRVVPYLGTLVGVMLFGGGQEEPGWRGYLLGRLEERHSPAKATLVLGLIWGVWHVPIYGLIGFAVPLVLAFFFTWLYNRTGSVLLAIVLHGGMTAAQDNLILLAEETHGVTDVAIGVGYLVGVAVLLLATRRRLGLPPGGSAPLEGPRREAAA